ERPGIGRFRCDLHHQQGTIAASIRLLPRAIPTFEELNLPPSIARFAQLTRGLVLFCGPTGCGKSTSMAALLEIINRTRSAHILTIDRLIDAFPDLQQNQVRQQLSLSLAGIVAQTLLPTSDGSGRVPAAEILLANDPVRNLIRTGKGHLLYSQITIGRKEGMMTME